MTPSLCRLLVCALAVGGATGCAEEISIGLEVDEAVTMVDLVVDRANASVEVFGDSVDPELVVARIGDATIGAADVAAYLRHFPTLTVEAAVEDLVDIQTALTLPYEADAFDVHDARVRGRVIAWMRANLWEADDVSTPDPSEVEELMTDPEQRTLFGTPELATATHVLLYAEGEGTQTPERAAAAEEFGRQVRAELATLERPVQGFDLIAAANVVAPEGGPLLELFGTEAEDGSGVVPGELNVDPGLVFPETFAGPVVWSGSAAMVPEFSEAVFAAELNQVLGPVQSQFGWHLIVVENKTPADMPNEEERRAMAEDHVVQYQRGRRFQVTVHRLIRENQIATFDENIALMSMDAEERIQQEAGQRGARFN